MPASDQTIKLHNSATRRKEVFAPLDPENVRMYVCGPTVYDRAHIGNARPAVVFDVLFRLLRHVYGADHVTYVRNITDIDDKINARGPQDFPDLPPLEAIRAVTEKTTGWYLEDMKALGCLEPTHQPRATAHVPQMVAMIETLIARGFAYEAEGHVLFEVAKYAEYGALSGRSTDDMIAGARVEVAPYKRDPMDFVLWKPSADDLPGWQSPWGRGRPGWHIECSAMAKELLGESFDIHGGGADLQFPHHENEVAQSCCAMPKAEFAKVWLHNGMIRVEGRKMSKSLGNFTTVEDLRYQMDAEFIRYALLSTRYRNELDWTYQKEKEAEDEIKRWYRIVGDIQTNRFAGSSNAKRWGVIEALTNDLNASLAFQRLGTLARMAENSGSEAHKRALKEAAMFMGFLTRTETEFNQSLFERENAFDVEFIKNIIRARSDARSSGNYTKADELRDALIASGVNIKDSAEGTKFELTSRFDHEKLSEIDL